MTTAVVNKKFGWDEEDELIFIGMEIPKAKKEGQKQIGTVVDTILMRGLVEAGAIAFATQWWQQLETATKDKLAIVLRTHISEGLVMEELIADIEPIFGAKRAEAIAVTEVTRLFTQGALLAYQASDVRKVVWRTCNDPWVCSSCGGFEGQQYDISQHPEQPNHVRCRCWLSPVVEESNAA